MKKIAVVGFKGKMGSLICEAIQNKYLIAKVGRDNSLNDFCDIDLVVDVASHESSLFSAEFCLKNNIPLVIGTTGQTKEENQRIEEIAKQITIVKKANFSNGIEVLKSFVTNILNFQPESIEIIEKHHIHKKDSPSGTALELKDFIEKSLNRNVNITSLREGEEMGEHKILVKFGDEALEIKHNVYSRDAFVRGVVQEVSNLLD